ncbi:MAG: RNA 2',3'-cyclic phosphodiesterase [Candidatus Daviesbacteria bacterium]
MRFFIALEIPEESKKQLEIVQEKLRQLIPGIRLTNNEKLHLTLAFVGEQPEEMRDKLVEVIKNAVWELKAFEVAPAYIDGFPDLHHANTFWIGVKGDIDKLFIIRERVKDGLIKLGLEVDERRYVPHIAIAKVGNFELSPFQEAQFEKIMSEEYKPIKINCLKLFESIPEEGFHRHNTLAEIPLS